MCKNSSPSLDRTSTETGVQVLVATNNAEYLCVKPAAGYKKVYANIAEQAGILYEVSMSPKNACTPFSPHVAVAASTALTHLRVCDAA